MATDRKQWPSRQPDAIEKKDPTMVCSCGMKLRKSAMENHLTRNLHANRLKFNKPCSCGAELKIKSESAYKRHLLTNKHILASK